VIAFDVNETLLDLRPLDPVFEGLFDDASLQVSSSMSSIKLRLLIASVDRARSLTGSLRCSKSPSSARSPIAMWTS
jgi:hypothetical protein